MTNTTKGTYFAIISYVAWGLLPIYYKLLSMFSTSFILGVRVFTTFIILLVILIKRKQITTLFRGKRNLLLIILAGISIGINYYLYLYAINTNRILEAGLAYYIAPIMTIFIGIIIFKEKKNLLEYSSIAVVIMALLYQSIAIGRIPTLSLSIALSWALYSYFKKTTVYDEVESLFMENLVLVIPAVFALFLFHPTENQSFLSWALLLPAGLVTLIPLIFYAIAAKNIPISLLGFLEFSIPITSTIIGIFIYKETMGMVKIISFCLITFAVVLYCIEMWKRYSKVIKYVAEEAASE